MLRGLLMTFGLLFFAACAQQPVYSPPPPGFPPPQQTPAGGQLCGGMGGARCASPNDYCRFDEQAKCGATDQQGLCTPRPQICAEIYAPICGCDGRTYENACAAARNGVSVVHAGQCRKD